MPSFVLRLSRKALPVLLLAMAFANPLRAVDGVIEINQVAVKVGGITPGDTPLFPVTINRPGSYRLTSNLDVTDATARPGGTDAEDTTAIRVEADGVSIDLNGFAIIGPTACEGEFTVTSCSPTGTGDGIEGIDSTRPSVRNGTVMKMGSSGLDSVGRAQAVTAVSNGSTGIEADIVLGCIADRNGGNGFSTSTASDSIATGNSSYGFSGTAMNVTNSQAGLNGDHGFRAFNGVLRGNTSTGNGGRGIQFPGNGLCVNNTVTGNDDGTVVCALVIDSLCNGSATCP